MAGERYHRLLANAGSATLDLSRELTSLSLEVELGRPSELSVRLPDPYRVLGHALQEGVELELELGTLDDHPLVFRGTVYATSASLPEGSTPSLRLVAYDALMRLGIRRRSRAWTGRTLGAIAKEIAGEHGLQGVDLQLETDPTWSGDGVRQRDETDLALLLRLASDNGAELWVSSDDQGDTLHIASRAALWQADPALTMVYGRLGAKTPLGSFEAESWTAGRGRDRILAGMLGPSGEAIRATTTPALEPDTEDPFLVEALARLHLERPKVASPIEQLAAAAPLARAALEGRLGLADPETLPGLEDSLAPAQARAANLSAPRGMGMQASGRASGQTPLTSAQVVRVLGVGGRFSGDWLVTRARRTLEGGNNILEFRCVR